MPGWRRIFNPVVAWGRGCCRAQLRWSPVTGRTTRGRIECGSSRRSCCWMLRTPWELKSGRRGLGNVDVWHLAPAACMWCGLQIHGCVGRHSERRLRHTHTKRRQEACHATRQVITYTQRHPPWVTHDETHDSTAVTVRT